MDLFTPEVFSPEDKPLIDLTSADAPVPTILGKDAAERRAFVYDMALGQESPGYNSLLAELQSGQEEKLKDQVVSVDMDEKAKTAKSLVQSYAELGGEDVAMAKALATVTPIDREGGVYERFTNNLMNSLVSMSDNEEVHKAIAEEDYEAPTIADEAKRQIGIHSALSGLYEDEKARYDKSSWVGWGLDMTAQAAIPLFTWWNMSNEIEGGESTLPYSNLREQIETIYAAESPSVARKMAQELLDEVRAQSPVQAMEVAQLLMTFGSEDEMLGNTMEVASLPIYGAAGKVARIVSRAGRAGKAVRTAEEVEKVLVEIEEKTARGKVKTTREFGSRAEAEAYVKETNKTSKVPPTTTITENVRKVIKKPDATVPEVLTSAGRVKEGAEVAVKTKLAKKAQPVRIQEGVKEIAADMPTFYDIKRIVSGTKDGVEFYYKDYAARLEARLQKSVREFSRLMDEPIRAATLPEPVLDEFLNRAKEDLKTELRSVKDEIVSVIPYKSNENAAGISGVEATLLNKGEFFKTKEQAINTAEKLWKFKPGSYYVVPEGDGWSIKVARDLNERKGLYLDEVDISTFDAETPFRAFEWFNLLRGSPKDFASKFVNEQRFSTSHGINIANEIAGDMAEAIRSLTKTEYNDLKKIMEINRDTLRNHADPDSRGMFYTNLNELDEAYYTHLKRFPTEREATAYFQMVQFHDFDLFMRNVNKVQEKARKGAMTFSVNIDGRAKEFDGIRLTEPPAAYQNTDVLIIENGASKVKAWTSKMVEDAQKMMKEQNYTLLQVYSPKKGEVVDEDVVNFVLSKDVGSRPLKFNQVNARPGFHSVYEMEGKIVQPDIVRTKTKELYAGDKIAYMMNGEKDGREIARLLNEARRLLKAGDEQALSDFLNRNLPISADEFKSQFKKGMYDIDTPFTWVRSGTRAIDNEDIKQLYPNARDFRDNPYNLDKGDDNTFMQERGRVINQFTKNENGWMVESAQQLDPIAAQNKEFARLIRNRFYEPLQMAVAENAIEEFGRKGAFKNVDGSTLTLAEMRRNPIYYFHNAKLSDALPPVRRRQIEMLRASHARLLGQPTKMQREVMSMVERGLGPELTAKIGHRVPPKLIPLITNPGQYMKAVAFYPTMAFFNPVQLFVQGQSLMLSYAFNPRYALQSTLAAAAQRSLLLTESDDIIAYAAQKYADTKITGGMRSEEFVESFKWLRKTGFDIIGSDHAYSEAISDPKVFGDNFGKKWLDRSAIIFKETERFVRMAAWNSAYMEYIAKNPKLKGKLTAADAKKIGVRADMMSANMSRDANAYWQYGVTGPMTQFYSYMGRMADLLTGYQTTGKEKAKIATLFAMLYGSDYLGSLAYSVEEGDPGAVLNQFNPFGSDLRTYAIQNGVDLDEGTLGLIANGIPGTLLNFIGVSNNYGERYGTAGPLSVAKQIIQPLEREEETWVGLLETVAGASGGVISDIIKSSHSIFSDLLDTDNYSQDVMMGDITHAVRRIGSVNQAYNLISAINTGKWYSRNNFEMVDGLDSEAEAAFYAISGLQPREVGDKFRAFTISKEMQKAKSAARREAKKDMQIYMNLRKQGEYERAKEVARRIDAILRVGGYNDMEIRKLKIRLLREDNDGKDVFKDIMKGTPDPVVQKKIKELVDKKYGR